MAFALCHNATDLPDHIILHEMPVICSFIWTFVIYLSDLIRSCIIILYFYFILCVCIYIYIIKYQTYNV